MLRSRLDPRAMEAGRRSLAGRATNRPVASPAAKMCGVFVASVNLEFVHEQLTASRLGHGARLLVVDGAGVPVASTDPSVIASITPVAASSPN